MAAADFLRNISSSISRIGQENNQFKQAAAQQNNSISRFVRDISKMFSSQARGQNETNASLNNLEQTSAATSQKVDQTNNLMNESISILTQMNNELKKITSGISQLLGGIGGNSALGNAINTGATLLAGGALGAGIMGATGSLAGGSSLFSNMFSGEVSGTSAQVLETIKTRESGGNYSAQNPNSSASGAYQFVDSTWQTLTQKYGIGTEYTRAGMAPPQVQDAVASKYVEEILSENNGDISKVPLVWYTGNAQGQMSPEALRANNGLTAQEYQANWLQDFMKISGSNAEKDESFVSSSTVSPLNGPTLNSYGGNQIGNGGGKVTEGQSELAGIRKLPLNPRLRSLLEQAAASVGVEAVVYSGGQSPKGSGGPRTGSTRHDNGNAADLYLMKDGRKLSDTNPGDKAIMAKFVSEAVSRGATGVGAGHGYMGPSNIHVGFGKPATWGGADWIKQAAAGVIDNLDIGGNFAQTGTGQMFGNMQQQMAGFPMPGMGLGIGSAAQFLASGSLGFSNMMAGGPGMAASAIPAAASVISPITNMISNIFGGSSNESVASNQGAGNPSFETQETEFEVSNLLDDSPKNKEIEQSKGKQVEGDENIFAKMQNNNFIPPAVERMQTAALETDVVKFNQTNTTQQSQQTQPSSTTPIGQNQYGERNGAPSLSSYSSSPSWYMQLAGRINYDEAMKFKGGVYAG